MISIIKKHWIVIVIASVVGIVTVLPTILSIHNAGPNWNGVYPVISGDETYYLSTAQAAYNGFRPGNPFVSELADTPTLQGGLPDTVLSTEAHVLGFSIPKTFALNDFALPFLGVIVLYILFFIITKNRTISIGATSLYFLVFLSSFNRPTSPQFNFLFFIPALLVLWNIFSVEHSRKTFIYWNVALGVLFGLLTYIYPFYWTAIGVVYVLCFVISFFHYKNYWYYIQGGCVFLFSSILVALPYVSNLLRADQSPYFTEAAFRNGFIFTHFPGAFLNVGLMIVSAVIIFLLNTIVINKKDLIFCYALALGGIALNWQNILTGKGLQFSSHYYAVIILFIWLIVVILVRDIYLRHTTNQKISARHKVGLCLMILFVLGIIYHQKAEVIGAYENIIHPVSVVDAQRMKPVFNWFNTHTPSGSVVYVLGRQYNLYLPIYTHEYDYFSPYDGLYLISDEELSNRWVIQHFFDPVTSATIRMYSRDIWADGFINQYQSVETKTKILHMLTGKTYPEPELLPQSYVDNTLVAYHVFERSGFERALKTYHVDYLMLDMSDPQYVGLAQELSHMSFLEPIAIIDNVIVYSVN